MTTRKTGQRTPPEIMKTWEDRKLLIESKKGVRWDLGGSKESEIPAAIKSLIDSQLNNLTNHDTGTIGDVQKLFNRLYEEKPEHWAVIADLLKLLLAHVSEGVRKRIFPYLDELLRRVESGQFLRDEGLIGLMK